MQPLGRNAHLEEKEPELSSGKRTKGLSGSAAAELSV